MKKILCLTLALLFITSLMSAHALAQDNADEGCDPYADIPINITPIFDDISYDYSADLGDIQKLAADSLHTIPRHESVVLGITHYNPVLEFHATLIKKTMSSGLYCAKVKSVNARIGYTNITVYIAREFPEGTCEFDHVMTHEQKHVTVNRELLEEFTPLIEERLKDYFRLYGTFQVEQPNFADSLINEKVKAVFSEMAQKMLLENQRRQKLVDSPEEYAKNNTACNGNVAKIARQFVMNRGN